MGRKSSHADDGWWIHDEAVFSTARQERRHAIPSLFRAGGRKKVPSSMDAFIARQPIFDRQQRSGGL